MMRVITGQTEEMNEAARMAAAERKIGLLEEANDLASELEPEYQAVSLYTSYGNFLRGKLSEAKRSASPDFKRIQYLEYIIQWHEEELSSPRLPSDETLGFDLKNEGQNDETLLEKELMGDFLAGKGISRVDKVKNALNKFKSGESSYVAAMDNLNPLPNFDSVGWRQHLEAALQETRRTDGQNFYRIRMLQNILSRA